MTTFRSILSLTLLTIALAPIVLNTFHAWDHSRELHCTDTQSSHMHEIEHQCKVCDLFYQVCHFIDKADIPVQKETIETDQWVKPHSIYICRAEDIILLRGPPSEFSI